MHKIIKVSMCQQLPFQSIPRSAESPPPDTPWHPSPIVPPSESQEVPLVDRSEKTQKTMEKTRQKKKHEFGSRFGGLSPQLGLCQRSGTKGIYCGNAWTKAILSGNWLALENKSTHQHCLAWLRQNKMFSANLRSSLMSSCFQG